MDSDDPMSPEVISSSPSSLSFFPALVQPLLALISPTPISFPPSSGTPLYPPITSVLGSIHICAIEALNNLFLSLSTSYTPEVALNKESGQIVWQGIWSALGSVGMESGLGEEGRQEIWETAVGLLWGIGRVWKGTLVSEMSLALFSRIDPNPRSQTKIKSGR
jgi:hypothetical protein